MATTLRDQIATRALQAPTTKLNSGVDPNRVAQRAFQSTHDPAMARLDANYAMDREKTIAHMRHMMDQERSNVSRTNALTDKQLEMTAKGYPSLPRNMSSQEQSLYGQAMNQGIEANETKEGMGRHAADLYKQMGSFNPALYREQTRKHLVGELASKAKIEEWLAAGGKETIGNDQWGAIMSMGGSDSGSTQDPFPHSASRGYDLLQREYIKATGQEAILTGATDNMVESREAQHVNDTYQFNALTKGGNVNWWKYNTATNPLAPQQAQQAGGIIDHDIKDEKQPPPPKESWMDNPIAQGVGTAAKLGAGGYFGYKGMTQPYGNARKAVYGQQLQGALRKAATALDLQTPTYLKGGPIAYPTAGDHPVNPKTGRPYSEAARSRQRGWSSVPRGSTSNQAGPVQAGGGPNIQPNPHHTKAASEVKKLRGLQRDLLRANGFTRADLMVNGKTMGTDDLQKFFSEQVKAGKIKKIPPAQKALMKKLGTGVLGGIWKKALASVVGSTAVGSQGGPWGSAAGFLLGLGMAAWTAVDVYNLSKDLMGDD
jgi:hypothetical protein